MTLLCSDNPAIPPLARLISELDTLSSAELETVATSAATRDLRAAALARVTRPALLSERAMSDPDAALRMAALERVSDPAALERIAERDYALVLSDLRMPEVDGPALYRALQERDAGWPSRMAFLTGDTLSPTVIGFLETANRPCLEKPFDAAEVRRVVAELLLAADQPSGTNM